MMEYKVCFHMAYKSADGTHRANCKMHYRGNTLEEAVEKALCLFMVTGVRRHTGNWIGKTCTSFTIQRGRRKGENVKWDVYKETPEGKALIESKATEIIERYESHSRQWGWEFLDA